MQGPLGDVARGAGHRDDEAVGDPDRLIAQPGGDVFVGHPQRAQLLGDVLGEPHPAVLAEHAPGLGDQLGGVDGDPIGMAVDVAVGPGHPHQQPRPGIAEPWQPERCERLVDGRARRGRTDLAGQRRRQLTDFERAVAGRGVDAFAGAQAELAKPFLTHADGRRDHAALAPTARDPTRGARRRLDHGRRRRQPTPVPGR